MILTLHTHTLGQIYRWQPTLDSTNTTLMRQADTLPHGFLLTAGHQTAGKGRLGRRWEDRPGASVCFSLLLRPEKPLAEPGVLPLLFGLGCAEGLSDRTGREIGLKWPNDLILAGGKLAGILCESRPAGDGMAYVCGVGLNRAQQAADFEGLPHAISLAMAGVPPLPAEDLIACMTEGFERVYDRWQEVGFAALSSRYAARCVTLGRRVRALGIEPPLEGIAEAIAPDGALLIRTGDACHPVHAGEVSVRGERGYL